MAAQHPLPAEESTAQQSVPVDHDQQRRRAPVPENTRAVVNQNNSLAYAGNTIDLTRSEETSTAPATFEGRSSRLEAAGAYLSPSAYAVQGAFVPPTWQPVARHRQLGFDFLSATFQYGSGELYFVNAPVADLAHPNSLGAGAVGDGVSNDTTVHVGQPGSEEAWGWYQANFGHISKSSKPQQQIDEFPRYTEPIDRSVTLDGICQDHPNHLNNPDVLDAFIQYFYTDGDIWDRLNEEFRTALIKKIAGKSRQTRNFMMRRLQRRWETLGLEKLRQLIEGPKIRVSELGTDGQPYYGRSQPANQWDVSLNPRAPKKKQPSKPKKSTPKDVKGPKATGKAKCPRHPAKREVAQAPPSAKGNDQGATALHQRQERAVDDGDWFLGGVSDLEPEVDLEALLTDEFIPIPVKDAPRGFFCGLPFWSTELAYQQFEESVTMQMNAAVDLARAVMNADPTPSPASVPAKTNRLMELMSWPLAIRKEVIEQWKRGTIPHNVVYEAFPKLLSFFVKEEVHNYLVDKNERDPKATAASRSGPRLITSMRGVAVSGVQVKMKDIIDDLEEKLEVVQRKAQAPDKSLEQPRVPSKRKLSGLKRGLEDEEADGDPLRKLVNHSLELDIAGDEEQGPTPVEGKEGNSQAPGAPVKGAKDMDGVSGTQLVSANEATCTSEGCVVEMAGAAESAD